MRLAIPGAAKALIVLTATGFLLSGCNYVRPYYGGAHFAPSHSGYKHHDGGYRKHGDRHHRSRGGRRGYR